MRLKDLPHAALIRLTELDELADLRAHAAQVAESRMQWARDILNGAREDTTVDVDRLRAEFDGIYQTALETRYIRSSDKSCSALAAEIGCSKSMVNYVKNWRGILRKQRRGSP
jgi:hypothetical protein